MCVFLAAVYGGYFGTGIGVLFFAILGTFLADSVLRLNALKSVLQWVANGAAGILFAGVAPVDWVVVLVLGLATAFGAPMGVKLAVHISPTLPPSLIGVFGLASAIILGLRAFSADHHLRRRREPVKVRAGSPVHRGPRR